jgi:hypothetical protein
VDPQVRPTHVLWRHVAYPVGETPMAVIQTPGGVSIDSGHRTPSDQVVCLLQRRDGEILVEPVRRGSARFGHEPLVESRRPALGDRLHIEKAESELVFIVVRDGAET